MQRFRGMFTTVILLGALVLGTGLGQADDPARTPPRSTKQEFLDSINNRPAIREHHTWGIFLGTGWSQEDLGKIQEWQREGKWTNPFTGQPFEDVKVFAFGHDNPALEGLRIVSDHLEVHVLSSWEELEGQHFDFVICHSNGCTNPLNAQRQGIMRAKHFLALGTDWTSKHFQPGDLKGADITFFAMASDPIWKIPAPDWARITDDAPGLKFTIPFDNPKDIVQGMKNLLTQGRADPDRFPVIRLEPPRGQQGELFRPFQAHALVDSYFESLKQWMKSKGPIQESITEQIRRADTSPWEDERKKTAPFPPGGNSPPPPGCPGCGGGDGPGGGGPRPQGPGHGIVPSTRLPDPRGGIAIDVHINPRDFQSQ